MAEKTVAGNMLWAHIIGGLVVLTAMAVFCWMYANAKAYEYMEQGRQLVGLPATLFTLRWAMAMSPLMFLWTIFVLMRRNSASPAVIKSTYVFIFGAGVYTAFLVALL